MILCTPPFFLTSVTVSKLSAVCIATGLRSESLCKSSSPNYVNNREKGQPTVWPNAYSNKERVTALLGHWRQYYPSFIFSDHYNICSTI
ncbi:uncharacterized protein BYT42DRAFT_584348 [Radiomyces spectabilis]|uniref:uncharacterized protein n=1 Tax=Radiomyces spectabilis TaxID=64574 RepID=UPI0022200D2F|nr:uncharacterized protein BYT42DRAFT_584348 [Radiomyces spectabilis]KAI8369409.1 hypothetical protein BYT42DRAFT_584348 [Radiomyces spectabilis]